MTACVQQFLKLMKAWKAACIELVRLCFEEYRFRFMNRIGRHERGRLTNNSVLRGENLENKNNKDPIEKKELL